MKSVLTSSECLIGQSRDIYFEPSITTGLLYHPQCQQYMKYLGSDGDIDLSDAQYIRLLGSNIISKGIENSYIKKNDISTLNDHTLIEVIKDEIVTFQKKIKYFTRMMNNSSI